jgi:AraC-like DNA-binding protein
MDPGFGPVELASAAGISLRYAQKLFTAHGLTCSEFIYSLRLEHAARLLQRRASLRTGQPLSQIAYACGFRDYSHFARKFRKRFGYPAAAYGAGESLARSSRTEAPSACKSAHPACRDQSDYPRPAAGPPSTVANNEFESAPAYGMQMRPGVQSHTPRDRLVKLDGQMVANGTRAEHTNLHGCPSANTYRNDDKVLTCSQRLILR